MTNQHVLRASSTSQSFHPSVRPPVFICVTWSIHAESLRHSFDAPLPGRACLSLASFLTWFLYLVEFSAYVFNVFSCDGVVISCLVIVDPKCVLDLRPKIGNQDNSLFASKCVKKTLWQSCCLNFCCFSCCCLSRCFCFVVIVLALAIFVHRGTVKAALADWKKP